MAELKLASQRESTTSKFSKKAGDFSPPTKKTNGSRVTGTKFPGIESPPRDKEGSPSRDHTQRIPPNRSASNRSLMSKKSFKMTKRIIGADEFETFKETMEQKLVEKEQEADFEKEN